jgi:CheY-like chemotaxis protein
VLVAEDNPINQKVAVRMLEKLGYRTDVAANGLEAVAVLSRASYAAVLMDVQMPELDGYGATAKIRRREDERAEGESHTPIIAMTANAMQGDREKALEAGMDDYVSKPVNSEELSEVLERWIQPATPRASVVQEESETTPDGDSARPATTAEEPLDHSVIESLRELGDPDLLAELVELFVDEAPLRLAALREGVESEDAGDIERVARTLKGSCGNMGARRMAEICEELQELGKSGYLARAPELLGRLEAEFRRVRPALEAEIKESW